MKGRTTAVLLVAVVALGAMTGVAAADGQLGVAVEQDADGTSTVTVTDNGTAVDNATVNVSVVDAENESYAGTDSYETDANGSVDLPAPEEDVTVNVTATADTRPPPRRPTSRRPTASESTSTTPTASPSSRSPTTTPRSRTPP